VKRKKICGDEQIVGEQVYKKYAETLERDWWGQFVMTELGGGRFVVAPTLSEVHRYYEERFGAAPGWCRRIGEHLRAG
jgi:hypothetical protein